MKLMTSYERKGWIEGEKKGRVEGKIEVLGKYLASCFPELSPELQTQLRQIDDAAILEQLSERIFNIKQPEQLRGLLAAALADCRKTNRD